MTIKHFVGTAACIAVAAVALSVVTSGATPGRQDTGQTQAPPPGPPPGPRGMGPHGMGPRGMGPGGPGRDIGRMLFDLDLTADQIVKIKTLMQAERDASSSYGQEMKKLDDQLGVEIKKDTFNEEAVTALVRQQAEVMVRMRVAGARTQSEIYKLLTAEQKSALDEMQRQAPPPRGGRRGH